jgi:hypothetical protein
MAARMTTAERDSAAAGRRESIVLLALAAHTAALIASRGRDNVSLAHA